MTKYGTRPIDKTITSISREDIPGSIGKKWGVTGAAVVHEGFDRAEVTIEYVDFRSAPRNQVLARAHELGHVSIAQDYVDGIPSERLAWDSYTRMPIFENEVEAWLRGIEADFGGVIDNLGDVHLILDCLNSYRRGHNATDDQWARALEVIADYFTGDPAGVWEYIPLEPEIDEELPNCQVAVTGPLDEFDERWNTQEVLDDLLEGRTIREVAARYGLNPAKVPPLAAGIWNGGDR
jgi:hypothetical protein